MPLKVAVDMAQSGQIVHGEVAAERQGAVQAGGGVPLGEDEAIPIRPFGVLGVDAQLPVIQISEHLRRGKASARMTRLRAVRRFDNSHADLAGRNRELLLFLIGHNFLPETV